MRAVVEVVNDSQKIFFGVAPRWGDNDPVVGFDKRVRVMNRNSGQPIKFSKEQFEYYHPEKGFKMKHQKFWLCTTNSKGKTDKILKKGCGIFTQLKLNYFDSIRT